ncbi:MAG: efflux RND transporter permease subunit [Gemmatimonadetes bacterium]|nr:efflux RND transporter permease subunit [Gemmatimonadota bacterium]
MKIAEFAVKNRQFTIVAFVALLAAGLWSLVTIPRAEDPTFPFPVFPIVVVYPGASPEDLEQLVVDPVEKRVRALEGIKKVRSQVEDGLAFIRVEFEFDVDVDKKYDEVVREVNALRPDLPPGIVRLTVEQTSAADVNILQAAIVSETAPWSELDARARAIRDALERIPGIRKSELWGYPKREVEVALDLGRLAALRIPVSQVMQAIGGESLNIPGGEVSAGLRKFNVKTSGSYRSPDEVRATVIAGVPGATVRVGDVATVGWSYAEQVVTTRMDGKRAIWVTAIMKDKRNILEVRDQAWAELDRQAQALPASMTLQHGFDQSRNVKARLSRLGEDFAIAILLVLVTLLPLGWRASAIVMVSIPLSLAIGVTLLKATGFTINQLSIVGFVIALGLLVDDSIVVVENISRFLREGRSRADAAVEATRQIGVAVLGTTATLIFAFVPLLMLPGGPGKFIRVMPAAVVYTILASLLVSLTIIPFLASLVLPEHEDPHGNRFLQWLNRAIDLTYARWLHAALARPAWVLGGAALLFVGALSLVPVIGFSLFPKAGTPQFLVRIEGPEGASLASTDRAVRFAEQALLANPHVRHVYANVGRGNPQVYYNLWGRNERSNIGELFVLLDRFDPRRTPLWYDSLRTRFDQYAGARIEVKEFENGPPVDAPIALRIRGTSLDTLRTLAARLEAEVAAVPGTRSVVNPLRVSRTDLKLDIDRAKAGLLGVPTVEVDRTVRLALAGLPAGTLRADDGQEYAVQVRLPRGAHPELSALRHTFVQSVTGALVPLDQLATMRFAASPPVIEHVDGDRTVTVTSDVATGYNTDKVTRAILAKLAAWELPRGYALVAAGEIESRQESFGGLGAAILVATFGILAILVLEFRTFRGMLIVASVIPLGVVGGVAALFVGGYTLSFTDVIGFVALIGIEIKNSILLVDFTNQLREDEGLQIDDAVEKAGKIRFVPIVLTTLTAIGGLLPLALQGSSLYSPLASVIIGGLISSTLLARLVTPVMYKLMPPLASDGARARPAAVAAGAPVPA